MARKNNFPTRYANKKDQSSEKLKYYNNVLVSRLYYNAVKKERKKKEKTYPYHAWVNIYKLANTVQVYQQQ